MCGRIALASDPVELAKFLNAVATESSLSRKPSFNVGPTTPIYAVTENEQGERVLDLYLWGLVPFWSKDPKLGARTFNARAETVHEKPTFRTSFRRKRCLIPVDAFYEWRSEEGKSKKVPYLFFAKNGGPLTFAGLFDEWESPDGYLISATIITTEANKDMHPYHHRMPLVLPEQMHSRWLHLNIKDKAEVSEMLEPSRDGLLEIRPADQRVGNVRFDDPSLLDPLKNV